MTKSQRDKETYFSLCTFRNFLCCTIYACVCAKSLQLCLTLCDPMDYSPPVSSVQVFFFKIKKLIKKKNEQRPRPLPDWDCSTL